MIKHTEECSDLNPPCDCGALERANARVEKLETILDMAIRWCKRHFTQSAEDQEFLDDLRQLARKQ
jgi:hypothetical protein